MVQSIKDLRLIDDEISKDYLKAMLHLRYLLMKSNYKRTAETCFMFTGGSDLLKSSILDCAEKKDHYSLSVLLRSLTEHYLRFNYFWFNYSKVRNDNYSMKFIVSLEFYEKLTIENAVNAASHLKNEDVKTSNQIWEEIKKSNPEFEIYTKGEIDQFSKSLSIKNIIRFIEKNFTESGFDTHIFLQRRIVEYAQLSSFVHGGIYAHKQMVHLETSNEKDKTILTICGTALQMASAIKLFSYLLFIPAIPKFEALHKNTMKLIEKIK